MKKIRLSVLTLFISIILFSVFNDNKVLAHATLEETTPQLDEVVEGKVDTIKLKFNEPVYSKYSGISVYDDKGKKISDVKPSTSGSSATLSFTVDNIKKGTHIVEWHAMSADGHEVKGNFQFSVEKVTATDIDTSVPFFKNVDFWFGAIRYLSQGAVIGLIGLFWLNLLAGKQALPSYEAFFKRKSIVLLLMLGIVVTLITYLMTLSSDVSADILTFKLDTLIQFPFVLTSLAIIVLLFLMMLPNMALAWYLFVSFAIILALSMSGHAWAQSVPLWSVFIRFMHLTGITAWIGALIYLSYYARKNKNPNISPVRHLLFKVNTSAVAIIIISGVLMVIDETEILNIWNNIQTWSALLIVKIILTFGMMLCGFYQTTQALKKQHRVNKMNLFIELSLGIILIGVGVMMSQINLPN